MLNVANLIGRLTKAPELRHTNTGNTVVKFTLAVNRGVQKAGQPDADFISCQAWNKTAELMANYLHKGSLIGVEGRIQTGSYENQQGQKVYTTDVIANRVHFLEPKESDSRANSSNSYNQSSQATKSGSVYLNDVKNDDTFDITEDSLPF